MILQQLEISSTLEDLAGPIVTRVEDTLVPTSANVGVSTPNTKVLTNVATSQVSMEGFIIVVSK